MMAGCTSHQKLAVEYRLSNAAQSVELKVDDLLETGKVQLGTGQNAMALDSFRGAIRQSHDNAEAYNGLAIAYDRIGREDLAQRYFETAMAKAPQDRRYRNNLARLFTNTGRVQLAAALTSSDQAETLATFTPELQTNVTFVMPEPAVMAVSFAESNIPIVDMTITQAPTEGSYFKKDVSPLLAPQVIEANHMSADKDMHFAILPMRKIPVLQAYVKPRALGPQAPTAPEPSRSPLHVGGTFDGPRMSSRRPGVRMERTSLGEVQLMTFAAELGPKSDKASFSSFENGLSSWLPEAISREQSPASAKQSGSLAILAAVERAQIELAFEQVEQTSAGIANFESSQFTYHFLHDAEDGVV